MPTASPPAVDAAATKQRARDEFDRWAAGYDQSILQRFLFQPSYALLMRELHRLRVDQQRSPRSMTVADVGCGTGQFCARVAATDLARAAIGLDYAVAMVEAAETHVQAARQSSELPTETTIGFIHGDGEHLPFPDASIDFLACANSFHHYPNQRDAIKGFARVLKPGGRLALIDGDRDSLIGRFIFDVCVNYFEGGVVHCSHSHVESMVREAGLSLVLQEKNQIWCPILLTVAEKPDDAAPASEPTR